MSQVETRLKKKLGLATRDAYGEALVELGKQNPKVVALDADLSKSTKSAKFGECFPGRFFNVGISEANMVGIAAGLASCGLIPFCSSFACFVVCKGYDQLRIAVAYSNLNVKVVGSHGGISIGEDGVSQMAIEDYALATSLPNFRVLVPTDEHAMRALVHAAAEVEGPVYLRATRPKAPLIYREGDAFEIGRARKLREGSDCAVIACGLLVFEALQAAELLSAEGIEVAVYDALTLKPLDEEAVEEAARTCGAVVTAEEHQIYGGLGSLVARTVAKRCPVPIGFVAIQDTYAESGTPQSLMEKYGLSAGKIADEARRVLRRKGEGA